MNLKDFQSKVKKIKAQVSMEGKFVCTAISNHFNFLNYSAINIDVGHPTGNLLFSVKDSFSQFFRPMTIEGDFLDGTPLNGFDGCRDLWLGDIEGDSSIERRIFWIEMWEQWMIVFGHYKKIKPIGTYWVPDPYAA